MNRLKKWLLENITLHQHDNRKEELVNGITHFIGIILSIVGIVLLALKDMTTPHLKVATIIYGSTMLLLFTASTVYHLLKSPILKRIGRVLDHCNIYLLIAGTYTPLAFYLGGKIGVTILVVEWFLTVVGIIFTLKFWGRLKFLHIFFYLVMGWMVVLMWEDFVNLVPIELAHKIITGGLLYSVGVVIYALKKIPFYHGIWHIFVVLGALNMYLGIYRYLV